MPRKKFDPHDMKDQTAQINFSFLATPSLKEAAKFNALACGMSLSDVLRTLMVLWLEGKVTISSIASARGVTGTYLVKIGKGEAPQVQRYRDELDAMRGQGMLREKEL